MTISIDETYSSREGTEGLSSTLELQYVVQGTDDEKLGVYGLASTLRCFREGLPLD